MAQEHKHGPVINPLLRDLQAKDPRDHPSGAHDPLVLLPFQKQLSGSSVGQDPAKSRLFLQDVPGIRPSKYGFHPCL